MKKILLAASAVFLLSVTGGCDKIKQFFSSEKFPVENVAAADSVTTSDGLFAKVEIDMDVPRNGSASADSIKEWILQSCRSVCESSGLPVPADGKLDQAYADSFVRNISADFNRQLSDPEWAPMGLSLSISFPCDTVTDRFATYFSTTDIYLGGAHGSYLCFGRTIILEDARWLTWDMIPRAKDQDFLRMVLGELASQYFETSEQEAVQGMFLPDNGELPFPVCDPVLTDKGLMVIYQQYEIAPYSAGLPSCLIPYDRLKQFVTPEAAALFPADVEGN